MKFLFQLPSLLDFHGARLFHGAVPICCAFSGTFAPTQIEYLHKLVGKKTGKIRTSSWRCVQNAITLKFGNHVSNFLVKIELVSFMEWNDLGSPGTLTCLDLNSPMGQVVILDDPFVMIPWWPGMLYGRLRCLPDWNHQGLWHVSLSGGRLHELGEAAGYFWRIYSQILYLKTLYRNDH